MNSREISAKLEEMAVLLELSGANPFRARAYSNAARAVKGLSEDIERIVEEDRLDEIKGVGKGIANSITELVQSGSWEDYDRLKSEIPGGLLDIVKLPGLGPKRVKTIYEKLNVTNIGELEYACRENRLAALPGFGEKTQEKVLHAIDYHRQGTDRHHYHRARDAAEHLLDFVKAQTGVTRAEIAGSLRRHRETIGDLDILATAAEEHREAIMNAFTGIDDVSEVIASGLTKSSVRFASGMNADLRIVSEEQFPFALNYFTGSKEHNTALRARAKSRGLRLNEYGLFRGDTNEDSIPAESEEDIYRALDLPYIPPELREDNGEFDAAETGTLPDLVTVSAIRGLLHFHTTRSDGMHTLEEMARAAMELGMEYVGVADHSRTAVYADGLTVDDIREQWDEVDAVNERLDGITVLKGIESDILGDGSLDYDDDVLDGFDFVIASVHSRFGMNEREATERLLAAIDHPATTILGHPTGRLLLAREGYPLDIPAIIERSAERGVSIELNASPHRLDLDWRWIRHACEAGVMISINPDAHSTEDLRDYEIGVAVGRKGWLEPNRVLNALSLDEFRTFAGKQ